MVAAACLLILVGCTSETKKSSGPARTIKVPSGLTGATCSNATRKVILARLEVYIAYSPTSSDGPCTVISAVGEGRAVTLTVSNTAPDWETRGTTTTTVPATTTTAPPWYPADYTVRSDEIAWRWMPRGSFTCDSGSRCWGVEVIAHYGCSDVYVELSVIDSADRVVDFANDSIGGLRAGQHGILKPSNYSDAGSLSGRVTSLTCN